MDCENTGDALSDKSRESTCQIDGGVAKLFSDFTMTNIKQNIRVIVKDQHLESTWLTGGGDAKTMCHKSGWIF